MPSRSFLENAEVGQIIPYSELSQHTQNQKSKCVPHPWLTLMTIMSTIKGWCSRRLRPMRAGPPRERGDCPCWSSHRRFVSCFFTLADKLLNKHPLKQLSYVSISQTICLLKMTNPDVCGLSIDQPTTTCPRLSPSLQQLVVGSWVRDIDGNLWTDWEYIIKDGFGIGSKRSGSNETAVFYKAE